MELPPMDIERLGRDLLTAKHLMYGLYALVDALLSAHPDRIRGNFAIDFRHCDLHPGNVLIGRHVGEDGHIACWLIDFSHSDIFHNTALP